MLIKTGDVDIIDIIDSDEVDDDDRRKRVLSTALDKAKNAISTKNNNKEVKKEEMES